MSKLATLLKRLLGADGSKSEPHLPHGAPGQPIDDAENGRYWEANAEAWTKLARMGCDVFRDQVNTPAFLALLPEVQGAAGIDIGCGEGYNTRLLAQRGAKMTGIDIAETFVRYAREAEAAEPLGIRYQNASAVDLPFDADAFDFAIATMSLMDLPDHAKAIAEAWRVVRPGGFFQFSISHPCFSTPRWRYHKDRHGKILGIVCGDYFGAPGTQIDEWIFKTAPEELKQSLPKFRIPQFPRTLSSWMNLLVDAGFVPERFAEPCPDEETVRKFPLLDVTRIVGFSLIVRCRKPAR